MLLAQEMRKIALQYHEVIDNDFLISVSKSIQNEAGNGKFSLELDVSQTNTSTLNKLLTTLRENGFKLGLNPLQTCVTIEW